jgi:carbon monoxide dehydrogenase subunit G
MELHFSGTPEITAPRDAVWQKLRDPNFVAASGPGVESVEPVDPTHYRVTTALGIGPVKLRFKLDVELFDILEGRALKMRARGVAPGSAVEVLSSLRLDDADHGGTRLGWTATSAFTGAVAGVGARLLEGTARRLTEQFWTDFARRAGAGGRPGR